MALAPAGLSEVGESRPATQAASGGGLGRVSVQVTLAVVAAATLVFGFSSYLILRSEREVLLTQMDRQAHLVSDTIKNSTRYDMMGNHHVHIHQVVANISRQGDIDLVRIFNKKGRVVYAPDLSLEGGVVDRTADACRLCHATEEPLRRLPQSSHTLIADRAGGGRQFIIINPIYNEPSCWQADCHAHAESQSVLGVLEVTLPLDEVDRRLASSGWNVAGLTSSAILAIVLILWLFFSRRVARPVKQLLEATNRVASGDLDHQLPVRRNDELGQLQRSFNEMTRRLATARSQVYQSDKLASIGRLAAGVAHEINNPLTGVLLHGSALRRRSAPATGERAALDTVVQETKRCREIVRGLLDFARQAPLRRAIVDINEVVEKALKIVDNELTVKGIGVTHDLSDELPPVSVDPNQIVQVLINLLVNAADAMRPDGGEVRVCSRLVDGELGRSLELRVEDRGRGIAEEDLHRVFEPFFTTKDASGTGLGLAVVWGIVEEHGGKVLVDSAPGQGTTVRIILPLTTNGVAPADEEESHA